MYLESLKKDQIQKAICLFAQSYREQPLEVNVMVTVKQFCDVSIKFLLKPLRIAKLFYRLNEKCYKRGTDDGRQKYFFMQLG